MKIKILFLGALILLSALPLAAQPRLLAQVTSVERWEVLEFTFQDQEQYPNPFWDIEILGQFLGPNGQSLKIRGFYYDTSTWKLRFAPTAEGMWSYAIDYRRPSGTNTFQGTFLSVKAGPADHGFILVNVERPHTFVQSDGTALIPAGINGHTPAPGAVYLGIDPGPGQVMALWDLLAGRALNAFRIHMFHQNAFEDTFSWNADEGCANLLYRTPSLDQYNLRVGKLIDRWFEQAKSRGIAIMPCLFSIFDITKYPFSSSPWSSAQGGPFPTLDAMYQLASGTGIELEKKYVSYVVSRWAAYRNVLLWEYNNEYGSRSAASWLTVMNDTVRDNDPYGRARTASFWGSQWSQDSVVNDHPGITVTDDHFYGDMLGLNEYTGDLEANRQALVRYDKYAKPVLFGEFGSGSGQDTPSWDTFQKTAYWGAFLGGGYPLFWLSGSNDTVGRAYNRGIVEFLGAVGRVVLRLRDPSAMAPANGIVAVSDVGKVRAYGLSNPGECLAYFHHFKDHVSSISDASTIFDIPGVLSFSYQAEWIDPSTGDSFGSESGYCPTGILTMSLPSFAVDVLVHLKLANVRIFSAPVSFAGTKVLNRSLVQAEYVDVLKWEPNPEWENAEQMKYRISRIDGSDEIQIAELDANARIYRDRKVNKNIPYTYSIVAVTKEGKESLPAKTIVN